jgi:SAM-dependent methyltransferase
VVALDCAFAPLRRNASGLRVCADAGDPPFGPSSFDAVVLANVLDACADPGLVLAQADALLAPGGTLVVTCAFAFQPTVTPRARWFDADALDAALHDGAPLGGWSIAPYAPVRAEHSVAWPLQVSSRTTHVHRVDVRVCRKRA